MSILSRRILFNENDVENCEVFIQRFRMMRAAGMRGFSLPRVMPAWQELWPTACVQTSERVCAAVCRQHILRVRVVWSRRPSPHAPRHLFSLLGLHRSSACLIRSSAPVPSRAGHGTLHTTPAHTWVARPHPSRLRRGVPSALVNDRRPRRKRWRRCGGRSLPPPPGVGGWPPCRRASSHVYERRW